MTPREKAVRLVDRYLDEVFNQTDVNFPLELPKRLAIIAVNEIINSSPSRSPMNDSSDPMPHFMATKYYNEVKQEIEKL